MHAALECQDRPGVYHPMFLAGPQSPAQEQWLDETCALVEAFASHAELDFEARLVASLAIHVAADFLFLRHAKAASWSLLAPAALAARLASEMSAAIADLLHALSAFYCFMAVTGRLDPRRAQYVASYFAAIATVNESSFDRGCAASSQRVRRV
jgi:hypothetical protein